MKSFLKKTDIFNILNAALKSYSQERHARKTLEYYRKQASNKPTLHGNSDIATAIRRRILDRGINPIPKGKGELHIFLAFGLNNWERVLPLALQPFGKVSVFEWRSKGFDDRSKDWLNYRDAMNAEMLKCFQKVNYEQPVDVVVGYLSGYNTDPNVLQAMQESGAIVFNFCWDDKLNCPGKIIGGRYTSPVAIASVVDLNLTNSPDSVVKYVVHDGLAKFWPEAAHPDIHKPYDLTYEYDVSFVGGKYGWRQKFIAKLQKKGIKVTCFGTGWGNGPLSDEEMVKLYSSSRINLGFAGVGHSKRLMCLKGRDFEVPMSGGLYLTQDNPELSLVYDVGKEIVTYHDETDCVEKIRFLLGNPEEAEKIRKAGRERALRDHTWQKRFEEVFKLVGIIEE